MPRNSSGTYSLPAGNPVVSNTLIATTWANPTMSDIGASITDSLDRYGRGGMLAQLKLADGTVTQPAFAFNAESSTGLYRASAGVMNVAILGATVLSFAAASVTFSQAPTWASDPASANQLTRKSYVDGLVTGLYLPLAGGTMTGAILNIAGTLGAPSWSFAGDTNTGLYAPSADILSLVTGGVEALRANASQNVGIGGSPVSRLHAFSASATNGVVASFQNSGNTGAGISFIQSGVDAFDIRMPAGSASLAFYSSGTTERMRLDAFGNLGINQTVPSGVGRLVIGNTTVTSATSEQLVIQTNKAIFTITPDGATNASGTTLAYSWANGGQGPLKFNNSSGEVARFDAAGNIGLGVAPNAWASAYKAFQNGQSGFMSRAGGSDLYLMSNSYYDGTNYRYINTSPAAQYKQDSGQHSWLTAASGGAGTIATLTNAMTLDASGVLTVGGIEVGYKDIPRVTGGFTRGSCYAITAGQTINTQAASQAFSVYNDSAAAVTITQGAGLTLRLNGTTTTGNRTLAARGFATIWFNAANEAVISGAVS